MIVYGQTVRTKVFEDQGVAAGGTATSDAIDLTKYGGNFSIQYQVSGSGTMSIGYISSNDGNTYRRSTLAASIEAGMTSTGGYDGDGWDIKDFDPVFSRYMKITLSETGGVSAATLDGLWLANS